MALLFRSIFEIEDEGFLDRASGLFREWIRWKLRNSSLDFENDGHTHEVADGREVAAVSVTHEGASAFRGRLFEKRGREEVRTTFTVIGDASGVWSWIDLDRWSEDAWERTWVPFAPGIVGAVLRAVDCRRGSTGLDLEHHVLERDRGALLARQVVDADREVPIVVATPTASELAGDLTPAVERAAELQRRLMGIAPVYLLGSGAVTAFSREMLNAGEQMDVHSGAVRTYLPGAGGVHDVPWRHRFVAYSRIARRPPDTAARLVATSLLRAASHQPPPPIWRSVRELPELAGQGVRDTELTELVDLAESELAVAVKAAQDADERASEAEAALELERETQAELLAEHDDLVRRLRYAEAELRKHGDAAVAPQDDSGFVPDFCEEVVQRVTSHLDRLTVGPRVLDGARELDDHAQPSWARKALRAFEALQAYAEAKEGGADGNFWTFCERTDSLSVVPTSWLAMQESDTTDQNPKFRALRTFEVDPEVDRSGRIYMPAHIKLEKGGYPSPRIHFFDDTAGPTGRVHIGWLGPHLDNLSKN